LSYINRSTHEQLIVKKPDCFNQSNSNQVIAEDLKIITNEQDKILSGSTIQYASTWILERDLWLQTENNTLSPNKEILSRGRVISVNPGVSGIGREQRYIHPYIVLGEYQDTFIGVPITNMAKNKKTEEYYLRHFFEVEMIHSNGTKPFTEYRVQKRSVADIRNISGVDKRRIIKDPLYSNAKFAPDSYLNAISEKIRASIAVIN
jgi:hypothetical protein